MLYEILEENGKFKLFFKKKKGLKFKKAFAHSKRESIEHFAESYLRHCCLRCKERGWVYKTRGSRGVHGGGTRHGRGNRGLPHWGKPPVGSIVSCPECWANHLVEYEYLQVECWGYGSTERFIDISTVGRIVLTLSPD